MISDATISRITSDITLESAVGESKAGDELRPGVEASRNELANDVGCRQ